MKKKRKKYSIIDYNAEYKKKYLNFNLLKKWKESIYGPKYR